MNKEYVAKIKSAGCKFCGEKRLPCLIFHHALGAKRHGIARMIWQANFSDLKAEIDKCIVICANCHMCLHAEKPQNNE